MKLLSLLPYSDVVSELLFCTYFVQNYPLHAVHTSDVN